MSAMAANPFSACTKFAGKKLHLGIGGSVACYKAADLLRALLKLDIAVSLTLTAGAKVFVRPMLFSALGAAPVYEEMFSDPDIFAHLTPGQMADAMLIAPASANLLSRLAQGAASDLLSAQYLAFSGPVAIAPAMNPRMWAHAATQANARLLEARGAVIVQPGCGGTACGDQGQGRLAELEEIFLVALSLLSPKDMQGKNVLVTLGPTREMWDGVRFWSNPSSGRMGAALATSAWLRGAKVSAVCGPGTDFFLPTAIKRIDVSSADEMCNAALDLWSGMDMGMFSAAVADFAPDRPQNADETKTSKSDMHGKLEIGFHATRDIMATLSAMRREGQKILGFAAQITPDMQSLLPLARAKLQRKHADIVAANRVNHDNGAFGSAQSSMAITDRNGHEEIWQPQAKADIAWELCSWLLRM